MSEVPKCEPVQAAEAQAATVVAKATAGARRSPSMRSSAAQQPPQRPPASHFEMISAIEPAPDAMTASTVRSVTALQEHRYTPAS